MFNNVDLSEVLRIQKGQEFTINTVQGVKFVLNFDGYIRQVENKKEISKGALHYIINHPDCIIQ